jgi:hypothetical protein
MKSAVRFIQCSLIVILSGCLPTVTKVYQAPKVSGQIINLQTMLPMEGVKVAHQQRKQETVSSDVNGRFVLPSLSATEFKLLMAAHAISNNQVIIAHGGSQTILIANATLNGQYEELVDFSFILFDTQPQNIAQPIESSYKKHDLLSSYFSEGNLLASCNQELSAAALAALNTSRKLARSVTSDEKMTSMANDHYTRTAEVWDVLKSSCERSNNNYREIDQIFEGIGAEISVISTGG